MNTEADNILLRVSNIRFLQLFNGSSLDIRAGEVVCLRGESGKGKSSFLRSLVLASPKHQAEVVFQGKSVKPEEMPDFRSKCVYVPQSPPTVQQTVEQFLLEPFSYMANKDCSAENDQLRQTLSDIGLNDVDFDDSVDTLSGGQYSRLHIARSTLLSPAVLILDEPTGNLDEKTESRLWTFLFSKMTQEGSLQALVVASHSNRERILENLPSTLRFREIETESLLSS